MRESGAPVRPVSLTAAFNVAHRFDNLAAADSHQVHAAHGIGLTRTPEITPSDYRAIAGHEHLLGLEVRSGLCREPLPYGQTRLASDVSRAIGRGLRVLDDAVFRYQFCERVRFVTLKRLV